MTVDLQVARRRLSERKSELESLSELAEGARQPVELDQQAVGRLSRMDAMQQQAMAQATERARQRDLLRIEMAERRIADESYGYAKNATTKFPMDD